MHTGKRILSILLCMAMLPGLFLLPAAATEADITSTLASLDGNTAFSWQKFYDKNTVNAGLSRPG